MKKKGLKEHWLIYLCDWVSHQVVIEQKSHTVCYIQYKVKLGLTNERHLKLVSYYYILFYIQHCTK